MVYSSPWVEVMIVNWAVGYIGVVLSSCMSDGVLLCVCGEGGNSVVLYISCHMHGLWDLIFTRHVCTLQLWHSKLTLFNDIIRAHASIHLTSLASIFQHTLAIVQSCLNLKMFFLVSTSFLMLHADLYHLQDTVYLAWRSYVLLQISLNVAWDETCSTACSGCLILILFYMCQGRTASITLVLCLLTISYHNTSTVSSIPFL